MYYHLVLLCNFLVQFCFSMMLDSRVAYPVQDLIRYLSQYRSTCIKYMESLTSSYSPIFSTPSNLRPNQRIPAVIPLPQLVTIGFSPLMINSAYSGPTACTSALRISAGDKKVVYGVGELGDVWVWRKVLKGSDKECGIWPDERPGRGSGSVPR